MKIKKTMKEKVTKSQKWITKAWDILSAIETHSKSVYFLKHIDASKSEFSDYYEKIETPMDLDTIKVLLKRINLN